MTRINAAEAPGKATVTGILPTPPSQGRSFLPALAFLVIVANGIGAAEPALDLAPTMAARDLPQEISYILPDSPDDVTITSSRLFVEPLIPMSEDREEGENEALARALNTFAVSKSVDALKTYAEEFPEGRWLPSLQLNMAMILRKEGFFSEALDLLEGSWAGSKESTGDSQSAMANRALAELVDLNARFGRFDRMRELLDEADGRDISGSSRTLIKGAREGYWMMTEKPAEGFRCGPYAVNAVLDAGKTYEPDSRVAKIISTQEGTNLAQLEELSRTVGLDLRAARRVGKNAPWRTPMVVHWKVGHFAALIKKVGGRYLVKDPTFGGEIWVTEKALESETSGYALVSAKNGKLPKGWTMLSEEEAGDVWGKGGSFSSDQAASSNDNSDTRICKSTQPGMAAFGIFKMLATLRIDDLPVGYSPPVGDPVNLEVSYKHLEAGQPANFNFTNFGPFWECNWISYLDVDAGGTVKVELRGGGGEVFDFSGYDPVKNEYGRALYSGARLIRTGSGAYERETADGRREVYSQAGSPGRFFLKELIDPNGNKITLNYDANLRLTTVVDAIGQATTFSYMSNTVGATGFYRVFRVTDPFQRYAEFTYDATLTRLIKIRDVIGMESSFSYGQNGFINRMTTPYGNTDFYEYEPAPIGDGLGRGLLVILPDGSREVMESYRGHTMMTYHWSRKAMAMAPGDRSKAEQTKWLMSSEGHLMMDVPSWTKKAFEGEVHFEYPGQPPSNPSPDPGDPSGTMHSYVGNLKLPSRVYRTLDDGTVQNRYFKYNKLGRVIQKIDPVGRKFDFIYSANEVDLVEVRQTRAGANELLAKWTYDSQHNPLSQRDASGFTTTYSYNSRGQLTSVTNARSETTTYSYDTNGYLTRVDGPLSGNNDRVDFSYDGFGRIASITSPQGPSPSDTWTASFLYDALDRLTQISYPDGTTEKSVYERLDLVKSKDRLNRWTSRVFSAIGQVIQSTDPAGRVTKFEWCRCGALQKLIDAMGNLTKWSYDEQGRLTRKTFADGSHQDYFYETTISRIKKVVDPAGNASNYSYALDDQVVGITFDPASGFADVSDISVSWDPNYPRSTVVADANTSFSFSYTPYSTSAYGAPSAGRGRLQSLTGTGLVPATLSFDYDELGRRIKRQIGGSQNESTWSYDATGRLSSWTNVLGTFTPSYSNASYGVGRMAGITFPSGQVVNFDWEGASGDFRLKTIQNVIGGSTLASRFDYTTDAVGRILQWKQARAGSATERLEVGYNPADEVVSAILKDDVSHAMLSQYSYSYDAGGNRTGDQANLSVKSASFNNMNQLTGLSYGGKTRFQGSINEPGTVNVGGQAAWMQGATNFSADVALPPGTNSVPVIATDAGNRSRTNTYQVVVPSGASVTMTYDAAGNLINDGQRTYQWDALSRLVGITYADGSKTEFAYDALGRRAKITEKNSNSAVTETRLFVFDGTEEAEWRDASNNVVRRYFSEGFQQISGSPSQSESFFLIKDHLGSTREAVDANGALVTRYSYDPYGRTTKLSGTIESDNLYTGHYRHQKSGLYLTMFRAYDPENARWLSRDPIAENGGINLYGYVANNPINLWDPLGLDSMNLINPKDTRRQGGMTKDFVDRAPLDPNAYTVAAHGNALGIEDSNGNPLSAKDLAAMIKADPNYDPTKPVKLNICSTGGTTPDGSPNFAQQLAKELGNTVIAPTGNLKRWSETPTIKHSILGEFKIGPERFHEKVRGGGSFKEFR